MASRCPGRSRPVRARVPGRAPSSRLGRGKIVAVATDLRVCDELPTLVQADVIIAATPQVHALLSRCSAISSEIHVVATGVDGAMFRDSEADRDRVRNALGVKQ